MVSSQLTSLVRAPQRVPGLVQLNGDSLPVAVDVIKLRRLPRQLTPDVLTQEDVLQAPEPSSHVAAQHTTSTLTERKGCGAGRLPDQ